MTSDVTITPLVGPFTLFLEDSTQYIARGTPKDLQYPRIEENDLHVALVVGEIYDAAKRRNIPIIFRLYRPFSADAEVDLIAGRQNMTREMQQLLIEHRSDLIASLQKFDLILRDVTIVRELIGLVDQICDLKLDTAKVVEPRPANTVRRPGRPANFEPIDSLVPADSLSVQGVVARVLNI